MALNDIIFERQNGGMGRPATNEDVVSGLLMSLDGKLPEAALVSFGVVAAGAGSIYVATLKYYEQLASQYGISEVEAAHGETQEQAAERNARNVIAFHVREFFRMSPTGTLYLAVKLSGEVAKAEIKQLQYYAGGKIRQMGVFTPTLASIASYQIACTGTLGIETGLEQEHQPLSLIVTSSPYDEKGDELILSALQTAQSHVVAGRRNVSVLISCDLDPELTARLGTFARYGCIGNCLGTISAAAVNESIAWVAKFPLGLAKPGFITGEALTDVTAAELNLLNDNRYIFVRTHTGEANCYYNDSHTLDVPASDYACIENVRTMDKATRGIRTNLLPYLNSPLLVDDSGKLSETDRQNLQLAAGKALEDMEKAGELSGYQVKIDAEQNVIETGVLEVQIKNIPTGVMRMVRIKIGFTTKLN
jgi:hypothetical protein